GAAAAWAEEAKKIAAAKKEYPERIRAFNRQLLEAMMPGWITAQLCQAPRVIAYRSAPEWTTLAEAAESSLIGEIGLVEDAPRSASCIAYGQYDDRYGGVRMVFVSKSLYE